MKKVQTNKRAPKPTVIPINLSNQEIVNAAWTVFKHRATEKNYDIHELTQEACDLVIKFD